MSSQSDDCEIGVEHALVLRLYVDSIGIEQNGQRIFVPMHAFGPLMTTLREMRFQAKGPMMDKKRIALIASIAHEANRAYCAALGDYSQLPWISAPQWQQDSAIAGVQAHLASDLTPEQSHEAWLAHKHADGWVYGPVKDPLAKQHPCCVPYDALPEEQRVKDRMFRNIVAAFKEPGK